MTDEDGFVAQVVAALSRALSSLVTASESREALGAVLARLGWVETPPDDVVNAVAGASTAIERLAEHVADDASAATLVADVISAIGAIAELKNGSATTAPFDNAAFWSGLPNDLIALLLCDELQANAPGLYGLLSFAGVLRVEARATEPSTGRQAYDARVTDWGVLGRIAGSPSTFFADVYGWGERFDHARFLTALADLSAGLGTAVNRMSPPSVLLAPYMMPDNPDRGKIQLLSISPFVMESPTLAGIIKPAMLVLPIPPATAPSAPPEGLLLRAMVTGSATAIIDLGPAAKLYLEGDFQATPLRVQIRPSGTVVEEATASLAMSALVDITPPSPYVMAGTSDGTRLELTRAHLGIEVSGSDVTIDAALDEAAAVLSLGGADSFLRGVMGEGEVRLSLAAGLSWSSASGLRFSGSAQPSLTIPTDIRIADVVTVSEIQIAIGPAEPEGVQLTVAFDGGFELGPLILVVEKPGLALSIRPATLEAPGNFGLLDMSLGFKPPTGLGLGVDIEGIITGGGYLSIDEGRYAGVAALQMFGVGLTVIGIVETELPGDPNGWSMFLSVIADFTPVPLGFGFFLSGVGGFMGLHRTLDEIALAEGVRDGRIDSLLFPEDPLADAMRIIADIEAYFPTQQGTHAFGAMARIDWGVPALISGELGIVLVVPDFRVAVVGEIEAILPNPVAPLIELHMGVVGYIDPAEATFWVTASIYDSRLAQYALSGDMAMYASFGNEPSFLLSVGGFHPDWDPPSYLPSTMRNLRRMTAAIGLGDNLQVGLDAYFAITSNTLQFGAEVFAIASMRKIGVDFTAKGSFGFDVLVIFTPFSITGDMQANVSIEAEGVPLLTASVTLHLEGPEPWFGRATASFDYHGLPINFSVAFGGSIKDDAPDTIDLWDELEPALRAPDSWAAPTIAANVLAETTMRPLDDVMETGLWLSPDGALELRQRVVPLNQTIEVFGAYLPEGQSRFDIEAAGLATGVAAEWNSIEDWFAPAQFVAMGSNERLSAPSFEEMDAGVTLSVSGFTAPDQRDDLAAVDLQYEELVLEDDTRTLKPSELLVERFGLGPRFPVFGTGAPASRRTVTNLTPFNVKSTRYDVADALNASRIKRGGTYADAVIARRGTASSTNSRARIVPTSSIQEKAG